MNQRLTESLQDRLHLKTVFIQRELVMKKAGTFYNNAGQLNAEKVEGFKMINPSIQNGSTVLFKDYEALHQANQGKYKGIYYGTEGTPTQFLFESAMTEIEGGYRTQALPSGINAIITVLLAFTQSGDHILVCDNIYGPTREYCTKVLPKFGVQTDFIPPDTGENISDYIKSNTRLIFLESPGSNTFEIQDIPAITKIAQKEGVLTVLDNTWATPLYLKPFGLGIDVSVHSVTKYISGHSDVLLGTVTTNEKSAGPFFRYCKLAELNASQNDCYLSLRGLRTLPVRLKHHEQAALEVAKWVSTLDLVDQVLHPALPDHPQHNIWKRDFEGSTGLFGFTLKKELTKTQIAAFVDTLTIFGIGYSWGGFKSLVTVGNYSRNHSSTYNQRNIFRLYIGMDDVQDVIADLGKAFNRIRPYF